MHRLLHFLRIHGKVKQEKTRRRIQRDEFSIDHRIRWQAVQRLAAAGKYGQYHSGKN